MDRGMTKFETEHDGSGGLPRRTLLKGAAWSVPVVALALATPAAAASLSTFTADVRDSGGVVQTLSWVQATGFYAGRTLTTEVYTAKDLWNSGGTGPIPAGGVLTVGAPKAYVTGFTYTGAQLDGVDVTSSVAASPVGSSTDGLHYIMTFAIGIDIPQGATLRVSTDTAFITPHPTTVDPVTAGVYSWAYSTTAPGNLDPDLLATSTGFFSS